MGPCRAIARSIWGVSLTVVGMEFPSDNWPGASPPPAALSAEDLALKVAHLRWDDFDDQIEFHRIVCKAISGPLE